MIDYNDLNNFFNPDAQDDQEEFVEEGDECPVLFCTGIIHLPQVEGCTCFINPPCSSCVKNQFCCDECGWSEEDKEEY
jgi:hypothetical protein